MDEIDVFVDISLSNFNKTHTPRRNIAMFGRKSCDSDDMSKLCIECKLNMSSSHALLPKCKQQLGQLVSE